MSARKDDQDSFKPGLTYRGLGHTPLSSVHPSCSPKESPEHSPFSRELQHWHSWKQKHHLSFSPTSPQAAQGWGSSTSKPPDIVAQAQGTAQSQRAAQAAFSILHTLLDSELDKSQSVQNGDHTTRSRIVGCSSIPMAQKHLVEVWRGQAGSGCSYCQLHLRFPKDRSPCSHPDRAQLAHTSWDSGATSPICLERTDWLKPAVGRGKCSKDLKCCATHIHTSKSLNPHHPFWSQTFPQQDSILTTLQEIRWW